MNIFELDQALVGQYAAFARSFSTIRAVEIEQQVQAAYEVGRFWPTPLFSGSPCFEAGKSVDELAKAGVFAAGLSAMQQNVIALDGGMKSGNAKIPVRKAMLYYPLKRQGLDIDPAARRPRDQQIILLNHATLAGAHASRS